MTYKRSTRLTLVFLYPITIFLFVSVSVLKTDANAQEGNPANLGPPNTEDFPFIQAYLDVRDQEGGFVYGLKAEDVVVLENEITTPVSELDHLEPGAQVVFVINPGPSFAIRDSNGLSRYDHIVQHLQTWAESRVRTNTDDLSLLGTEGVEITHLESSEDWLSSLLDFQPDARNAIPNYDMLSRGLEIASDLTTRQGMGRSVIFITSLPPDAASFGFQSIISRANQAGVQINVWLVASPERFSSQGAAQLLDLATQTGGELIGFSGLETLPSIEAYLEPLRNIYTFKYQSMISDSGTHQMIVRIKADDFEAISNEQSFELDVLPPNIAFVSPKLEISRTFLFDDAKDPDELTPKSQLLEVLVEFPDGYERSVEQTTLYVDGQIESRNTKPPYDFFTWDLSDYTNPGDHTLRAEVVDGLGLSSSTLELTARIVVEPPKENFIGEISRNRLVIAVVSAALASAILLWFLVLGGRLHPGTLGILRLRRKRTKPVARPVQGSGRPISQKLPYWVNRLQWPQRSESPNAVAYLTPLKESEDPEGSVGRSIPGEEVSIGRDASLVTIRLDEPSVDPLHARLTYDGEGIFLLVDEGSIAGTWINYTPVPQEGQYVEHGDLIHFGRAGFRITYHEPKRIPQLVILEEDWRR